jgi:hypothetical protein
MGNQKLSNKHRSSSTRTEHIGASGSDRAERHSGTVGSDRTESYKSTFERTDISPMERFIVVMVLGLLCIIVYKFGQDPYHGLILPSGLSFFHIYSFPDTRRITSVKNGLTTYLRLENPNKKIFDEIQSIFSQIGDEGSYWRIFWRVNKPTVPKDFEHNLNHIINVCEGYYYQGDDWCNANKRVLQHAWQDGGYLTTALFLVYDYIDRYGKPPPEVYPVCSYDDTDYQPYFELIEGFVDRNGKLKNKYLQKCFGCEQKFKINNYVRIYVHQCYELNDDILSYDEWK